MYSVDESWCLFRVTKFLREYLLQYISNAYLKQLIRFVFSTSTIEFLSLWVFYKEAINSFIYPWVCFFIANCFKTQYIKKISDGSESILLSHFRQKIYSAITNAFIILPHILYLIYTVVSCKGGFGITRGIWESIKTNILIVSPYLTIMIFVKTSCSRKCKQLSLYNLAFGILCLLPTTCLYYITRSEHAVFCKITLICFILQTLFYLKIIWFDPSIQGKDTSLWMSSNSVIVHTVGSYSYTDFIQDRSVIVGDNNIPGTGYCVGEPIYNYIYEKKISAICGVHPHGGVPTGLLSLCQMPELKSHGIFPRIFTHTMLHIQPILTSLLQAYGMLDVSKISLDNAVKNKEMCVLIPGGAREFLFAGDDDTDIRLVSFHRGFIKYALQNQLPLVPIISMGEWNITSIVGWWRGVRFIERVFSIPYFVLVNGVDRLLGYRKPITLIIGRALVPQWLEEERLKNLNNSNCINGISTIEMSNISDIPAEGQKEKISDGDSTLGDNSIKNCILSETEIAQYREKNKMWHTHSNQIFSSEDTKSGTIEVNTILSNSDKQYIYPENFESSLQKAKLGEKICLTISADEVDRVAQFYFEEVNRLFEHYKHKTGHTNAKIRFINSKDYFNQELDLKISNVSTSTENND